MTVRELINELEDRDPEANVYYYDGHWDMAHPVEVVARIQDEDLYESPGDEDGVMLRLRFTP